MKRATGDRCHTVLEYLDTSAPILFFTLTDEGSIVSANIHAQRLTGRQLVDEQFQDVIVDHAGEFALTNYATEESKERLLHIITSTRLPQTYYFTFRRTEDRILVFGRLDAEEIEHMQADILHLNQELNNLTRNLQKKNAQLKQLNDEKNRFLGMAAHDLRKPIGIILSYCGFLIEETRSALNAEHNGFLNTIHSTCAFMKRLVDDFLDVSAIEAGKFELTLHPTDFGALLSQCLQFNALQAKKKGVGLSVYTAPGLPRIPMDAPKIQQAVTNVISNAIEYSQPDTEVGITLSKKEKSVVFAVSDSGPGIKPEDIHRIFRPYGTTGNKKTAGEKSTGLGLLITRKVIETHGGKIWIESKVGEGTTLFFTLPVDKEE